MEKCLDLWQRLHTSAEGGGRRVEEEDEEETTVVWEGGGLGRRCLESNISQG